MNPAIIPELQGYPEMINAIAYKDLDDIEILVEQISASTGLSKQSISDQLNETQVKRFQFEEKTLVSPNDLDGLIDSWAANIKSSLYLNTERVDVANLAS